MFYNQIKHLSLHGINHRLAIKSTFSFISKSFRVDFINVLTNFLIFSNEHFCC
ncbi:MAG: hypothetical protein UZ08_BCD001002890 [Candidatus Parvibacillus calidus]|mgnify:CR=1 FL=1|jgi:hypothetical protein|nr:MAG: hypothetical protein UZ08_BCD001002890 [Candidatus Parvibacillus calidus]